MALQISRCSRCHRDFRDNEIVSDIIVSKNGRVGTLYLCEDCCESFESWSRQEEYNGILSAYIDTKKVLDCVDELNSIGYALQQELGQNVTEEKIRKLCEQKANSIDPFNGLTKPEQIIAIVLFGIRKSKENNGN